MVSGRDLGRNVSRCAGINDVKSYVVKVTALLPEPVSTDVELAKSAPRLRLPQLVLVSQLRTSVTGFYSEPEESPAPEPHPPSRCTSMNR